MERHDATNCGLSTREDDDKDDEHDHDYDDEENNGDIDVDGEVRTRKLTHTLSRCRAQERETQTRETSRVEMFVKNRRIREDAVYTRDWLIRVGTDSRRN